MNFTAGALLATTNASPCKLLQQSCVPNKHVPPKSKLYNLLKLHIGTSQSATFICMCTALYASSAVQWHPRLRCDAITNLKPGRSHHAASTELSDRVCTHGHTWSMCTYGKRDAAATVHVTIHYTLDNATYNVQCNKVIGILFQQRTMVVWQVLLFRALLTLCI